jgi:hypothetical protein
MSRTFAAFCGLLALASAAPAGAAQIQGDYLEARTADVYTGPCFSNAEAFITGNQALMAWKVTKGSWDGVDVSGLGVIAAVQGTNTFSVDQPEQAQSILIVDKNANSQQRSALIAMAKSLAGGRLSKVVDVKTSLISLTVEDHATGTSSEAAASHSIHKMPVAPRASLWAPGLAEILTRPLDDGDHACGNEVIAYEPLSKGVDVLPAYTLGHEFKGQGLETRWSSPNRRSSFVGHFAY